MGHLGPAEHQVDEVRKVVALEPVPRPARPRDSSNEVEHRTNEMDELNRLVLARMRNGSCLLEVKVVERRVEGGEVVDRGIEEGMKMWGERAGERGVDGIESLHHDI